MAIRKSSSSGIPFGLNAGRPANPSYGQLYSNGQTARLEIYTQASGWQNIVQETPGVASATGHYYQSDNYGTFVITGTNFVDGAIAYAVGTNGVEYQAQTTTYNSLVQITTTFANLSADYEPYDIKVINPSNLFGLLPDAFYVNDNPVWSTSAGLLGTYTPGQSVSIQLAATDDESNTLTYTVSSGSLPSGISLSSAGLISGTTTGTAAGTYNFTISVSDSYNAVQNRSFSIVYNVPVVTGGILSSDSTYYYRTFIANGTLLVSNVSLPSDILVIAGGGAGGLNGPGQGWGNGGGAGGAIATSSTLSLSASSHSIVIGAGGNSGTYGNGFTGNAGSDSYFDSTTYSAKGGGGGGNAGTVGASGGCGGGSGSTTASSSTQTSPTGYVGYGFGGGTDTTATSGGGGIGQQPPQNARYGGSGKNTWSSWLSAITSQMTGVSGWSTATSGGYIAGGGAGSVDGSANGGGGAGGGGSFGGTQGGNGVTNTGSGGGGTGGQTPGNNGNGGSGIVIVRYTKASVGG